MLFFVELKISGQDARCVFSFASELGSWILSTFGSHHCKCNRSWKKEQVFNYMCIFLVLWKDNMSLCYSRGTYNILMNVVQQSRTLFKDNMSRVICSLFMEEMWRSAPGNIDSQPSNWCKAPHA